MDGLGVAVAVVTCLLTISIVVLPSILVLVALRKLSGLERHIEALARTVLDRDRGAPKPIGRPMPRTPSPPRLASTPALGPIPEAAAAPPSGGEPAPALAPDRPAALAPPPVGESETQVAASPPPPQGVAPRIVAEPAAVPSVSPPALGLEVLIGQRWLVRIGAVVLLCGMGFLFKYSIEHQLISETARVITGVVLGVGLWGLGLRFYRRGYGALAQGFEGCGSAVLYLSLFAAEGMYALIGAPAAFGGMVAVTAATVVLALRQDAMPLAILAQLGGLLTPLLVGKPESSPHVLFAYLFILDAGLLAASARKRWTALDVLGFVGTAVLFVERVAGAGALPLREPWTIAAWASALAALWLAGLWWRPQRNALPRPSVSGALLGANAALWAWAIFGVLFPADRTWCGVLLGLGGAVHLGAAQAGARRGPADRWGPELLRALAAALFLSAVPGLFRGAGITMGWAGLGVGLAAITAPLASAALRGGSIAALMLALARVGLFHLDLAGGAEPRTAFWNQHWAASMVVVVAFLAAGAVDRGLWSTHLVLGGLTFLMALAVEIERALRAGDYDPASIAAAVSLSRMLVAAAGMAGFAALSEGGRRPALTAISGLLGLAGTLHFVPLLEEVQLPAAPLVVNGRCLGMLILPAAMLASVRLLRTPGRPWPRFGLAALLAVTAVALPLVLLSFESWRFFEDFVTASGERMRGGSTALSVTWTVYAAGLLAVGIARRVAALRLAALALFAVTLGKVAFHDLASLDQLYRIISFIALGVVLMTGAWLYHRFDRWVSTKP